VTQLGELSHLAKEKAQILAVSIDSHADSQKLLTLLAQAPSTQDTKAVAKVRTKPTTIDFPLLEDANHRVIDRYGLLNPTSEGWPHPATYVIDKQGIVRWKFVEVDYTVRATNDMILQALTSLP
jgi:peroxiredoxin